jgi:hypothetical protein
MRRFLLTCITAALLASSIAFAQTPIPSANAPKNPKAAAFLSILMPGLGELYAGGPRSGRFFLFTEASLWTGMVVFEHLETTRRENFKSYAAAHAGLSTDGKSDTYLEEVNAYGSISARNAHEQFIRGDAADLIDETPENVWEWDWDTSRSEFRVLRRKANSARQKGLLFVGGLIFNRFVSSINAAHIARKTLPRPVTIQFVPQPGSGFLASLTTSF